MYRIWNHIWHVRYWIIFVTVFCHVRIMSLDYLLLCGLSLLLVLSFARRGFSAGTPVFPSFQKPTFSNSNSTRNQVDEEPLCGCATSKSLFIHYLFNYLFIYLFIYIVIIISFSFRSWHVYLLQYCKFI